MLIHRFYREKVEDRDASVAAGQMIWKDEVRCDIIIPGDREEKVVKIITKELIQTWRTGTQGNNPDKGHQALAEAYERWLKNEDEPVEGTPLELCGFLTPAMIENLKAPPRHTKTVEQLAGLSDAQGAGIPYFMSMRDKAKLFIEAQTGPAALAAKQTEQAKMIAQQTAQILKLTTQIGELLALQRNGGIPSSVAADDTSPAKRQSTGVKAVEEDLPGEDDDPNEGMPTGAVPASKGAAMAAKGKAARAKAEREAA